MLVAGWIRMLTPHRKLAHPQATVKNLVEGTEIVEPANTAKNHFLAFHPVHFDIGLCRQGKVASTPVIILHARGTLGFSNKNIYEKRIRF